jgi:hypothetical protein
VSAPARELSAGPWWIDSVRAHLYRALTPWFSSLYADRARRVVWLGLFSIAISFSLTLISPLWLLALGPVILGVPHLVADARYLVVQPKLHERGALALFVAVPLVATGFGVPPAISLLSLVPAVLMAQASAGRKALGLAAWAALTAIAIFWETHFLLAFLHVHNLVAVGWWWAMRPRTRHAILVPAAVFAGTAFLLAGEADPIITALGGWSAPASGASFTEFVQSGSPVGMDATLAARLVLSFAFLQSVHYAMWLRLVPEDARTRPAPRPFRATWDALVKDFGLPMLIVFFGLTLFIAGWGLTDLASARWGYLRLAAFHGYLELAAAAYFLVERKRPAC